MAFGYRRRKTSLLTQINDEKSKDNELRLRDLKEEADKITKNVKPIILSNKDVNIDTIKKFR